MVRNEKLGIAVVIGLAVIVAAFLIGNAYKYKFKSTQNIEVTGLAKKDFASDLVRWSATFQKKDFDLKTASEELNKDKQTIQNFLTSKGINKNEIIFPAITISKDYQYSESENGRSTQTFDGYVLSQSVVVESKNLDKVEAVSREISNLIAQGIELNSNSPNYYYSKLEDLKLELISEATENARKRAENIAEKADADLGKLLNAKMGVFQITGQNEEEDFSYGGVYNTTSRDKTANITVKLIYESD